MKVQFTIQTELNLAALGITSEAEVTHKLNKLLADDTTLATNKFLSATTDLLKYSIQYAIENEKRRQYPTEVYTYTRADGCPGESPKWYVETLLLMKHVFITFKNVTAKII